MKSNTIQRERAQKRSKLMANSKFDFYFRLNLAKLKRRHPRMTYYEAEPIAQIMTVWDIVIEKPYSWLKKFRMKRKLSRIKSTQNQ